MNEPLRLRMLAREYSEAAQMISAAARTVGSSAERDMILALAAWYGAEGARLDQEQAGERNRAA